MEKYKEYIAYEKLKIKRKSGLIPLCFLITLFGAMSISISVIESEGLIVVTLINIINISFAIKSGRIFRNQNREELYLYSALLLSVIVLCLFELCFVMISIEYNQILLLKGLICVSASQMILIAVAVWLISAIITAMIIKKKINNRWYKGRNKKFQGVKAEHWPAIIGLGMAGSVLGISAKGIALCAAIIFIAAGGLIVYIVQCLMCHYYVKKYSLADAINTIVEKPEEE